jgi:hypothetical protein
MTYPIWLTLDTPRGPEAMNIALCYRIRRSEPEKLTYLYLMGCKDPVAVRSTPAEISKAAINEIRQSPLVSAANSLNIIAKCFLKDMADREKAEAGPGLLIPKGALR